MEQKATTSGSMKISEDVVRTIVKTVLSEIDGVSSLASHVPGDSVWKNPAAAPVSVSLEAEVAVIGIAVNLSSGYRLKDVAEQIQTRVKNTVQDMTGIAVSRVNIYVAGIQTGKTE